MSARLLNAQVLRIPTLLGRGGRCSEEKLEKYTVRAGVRVNT